VILATAKQLAGTVAALWLLLANHAIAQQSGAPWSIQTDIQGFLNSYTGTADRERLANVGLFLHANYFERAGITAGYNRTVVNGSPGVADVHQNNRFLSGRFSMTPDRLSGRLTVRLDKHSISNDDGVHQSSSGNGSNGGSPGPGSGPGPGQGSAPGSIAGTGRVDASAAQISYLNFPGTFYWDLGFAKSEYKDLNLDGRKLEIDQLTPTIGLAFNDRRDWLQLRAYLIDASIPALALGKGDTTALELKWTHWPLGGGVLGFDNYRVGVMAGDRVFAADPDAGSLFNLAERQTGIVSIGGEWAVTERSRILVLIGSESYKNSLLARDYRSTFLLLNLSHRWE
jgi:hypothetical protein